MGLFIVPDIRMAEEVKKRIPHAEIATGVEELQERGLLDKVTSEGEQGKVIITTWIAHRDIDVKMPPEVVRKGGLDCVVCGIPPTERGLWQALQRALRGDQPGTRSLLLTPEDFEPLRNRDVYGVPLPTLIHRPVAKTHAEAVKKIDNLWKSALQGDRHAMRQLFGDYLKYLRGKEEMMKGQLVRIMMRDSDLEKWQALFVEMKGKLSEQLKEYREQIRTEAQKRIPKGIPSVRAMPARQGKDRRMDAILARLENQFGYIAPEAALVQQVMEQIGQEDIRYAWADFLRFLELDAYTFSLRPDIQKLPLDLQRGMFRSHVESLLKQQETEQW